MYIITGIDIPDIMTGTFRQANGILEYGPSVCAGSPAPKDIQSDSTGVYKDMNNGNGDVQGLPAPVHGHSNVNALTLHGDGDVQDLPPPIHDNAYVIASMSEHDDVNDRPPYVHGDGISDFRNAYKRNMIFGSLNINSLRNKFYEIKSMLVNGLIDILFILETKLDESFTPNQFCIDGFMHCRRDRNEHGGGMAAYIRSDIPFRRRTDIELIIGNAIESIAMEVHIRKEKWLFIGVYKPPSIPNADFVERMSKVLNSYQAEMRSTFLLGDVNINMASCPAFMTDFMELYGLSNMVNGHTCFKRSEGTSIDVILTDSPGRVSGTLNYDTGLSDFHNIICASTKLYTPKIESASFHYRSYKNFDNDKFMYDISIIPFHVGEIFDDINDSYWLTTKLYLDVVEEHAPLKKGKRHPNHAPYMNSELRKACNVKAMLRRKYLKFQTPKSWELYRKQRNLVSKLRAKSINNYFAMNCNNVSGNAFWNSVKPFMSHKSHSKNEYISLYENNRIVNDKVQVANMFNDFFVSSADSIGNPDHLSDNDMISHIINMYDSHASILEIKKHVNPLNLPPFDFVHVTKEDVYKELTRLNTKKATGADTLPPRLLQISAPVLAQPVASLLNKSIDTATFPDGLKVAEVSPLHKKGDTMSKKSFRPVSILPSVSKIFERLYCDQMLEYYEVIMSKYLSAFRKGYSCESLLIRMVEDWKQALDQRQVVGAMLIDLSKAFDCLPHRLLLAKLNAYGMSENACTLIKSYLSFRNQRVKINDARSTWVNLKKGVPQGSIMGPLLFNLFINDIFYVIKNLYNYADDNTIAEFADSVPELIPLLQNSTSAAMDWFHANYMQANAVKFQAMILGSTANFDDDVQFQIDDVSIKPSKSVKLLGVEVDNKLNFNEHISNICRKSALQINALRRICKHINIKTRITLFNAFILSNFNYCSLVWHYCSTQNTAKIEKLQGRALRVIFGDYDSNYMDLLSRVNKDLLFVTRLKRLALLVFKCINETGPSFMHDLFNKRNDEYGFRDASKVMQPKFRTVTYGKSSLRYGGAALWNNLPNDLKQCVSENAFKNLLKAWEGPNCSCGFCLLCKLKR